jgi:hypothetical protein
MTTDNFCFYLQKRLIQTSHTGGQWYSDTSPFSILDKHSSFYVRILVGRGQKVLKREHLDVVWCFGSGESPAGGPVVKFDKTFFSLMLKFRENKLVHLTLPEKHSKFKHSTFTFLTVSDKNVFFLIDTSCQI